MPVNIIFLDIPNFGPVAGMKGMKRKNVWRSTDKTLYPSHHKNRCVFGFTEQNEGSVQHSPAGGKM